MKDIILVYTSSIDLPDYVNDSIEHILASSFDSRVHILCDGKFSNKIIGDSRVVVSSVDNLEIDKKYPDFSIKKFGDFNDNFYSRTSDRFLYISSYATRENLSDFWHIEADNLIFGFDIFSKRAIYAPGNIGLVMDSGDRCVPSLLWFRDSCAASFLADFIYCNQWQEDMISLAKLFNLNRDTVFNFPIIDSSEFNSDSISYDNLFNLFSGFIFDGAAMGQYLFGIDKFNPYESIKTAGFINETCKVLYDYSKIKLGRDLPRFYNGPKIANLHVHSKNLKWAKNLCK